MKALPAVGVALIVAFCSGAAFGQAPSDARKVPPMQQRDPWAEMRQHEEKSKAMQRPTKVEPMNASLAQLLNEGWSITSGGLGPMGTQFILYARSPTRWALCDLIAVNGNGAVIDQPVSRCLALN